MKRREAAARKKKGRYKMIKLNAFGRTALSIALVAGIAAGSTPATAQASRDGQDRRVMIQNRASQPILYVRGSPTTQASFGEDRIPDRVIASGAGSVVDFDSGTRACMYDLRVTMADGTNIDRMNVNVCRVSRWTIGNRTNDLR
jgi:hypothetical protein